VQIGRDGSAKLWASFAILAFAAVAVQIPFLMRGISFNDEGSILAIADGLANGERLYADRSTVLGPLTYELLALLFRLLGPRLLIGRVLSLVSFAASALLCFEILRRTQGRRVAWLGALAVIALKPLAFPLWTIVNYSSIALPLALGSLAALLVHIDSRRLAWLALSGTLASFTILAKQNIGLLAGSVIALAIALQAKRSTGSLAGRVWRPLAAASAGFSVAIGALLLSYDWQGNLGAFAQRAILGSLTAAKAYGIPLPPLCPWAWAPESFGARVFSYLPAAYFNLLWEGRLKAGWILVLMEILVKLAYLLPPTAAVLALGRAFSGRWNLMDPRMAAPFLFGTGAYLSMLYRPDWAHLVNVAPAALLLVGIVWPSFGRIPRGFGIAALALWLAGSVLTFWAVLRAYDTRVSTPVGTLVGASSRAAELRSVMAWVSEQPRTERVLFLRGKPLYYFLSGRQIPIRFDLLMPGLVKVSDDREIAHNLSQIDTVVYQLRETPLIPLPIGAYAPRTAQVLARYFRLERRISDDALLLRHRSEPAEPRAGVRDLWRESASSGAGSPIARYRWLFFDVLTAREAGGCLHFDHIARSGEALTVTPLLRPDLWGRGIEAELLIRIWASKARGAPVRRIVQKTTGGFQPLQIGLEPVGGLPLQIELCTDPREDRPTGFGNPRITRVREASAP